MSRWNGLLARRRTAASSRTRRQRSARDTAERNTGTGAGQALRVLVENHGGLLLLRLPMDDTLHPADVADLARALGAEEDGTVTIVAIAVGEATAALWPRLSETLDSLRDEGTSSVRLVMSGAGADHPDRPALARHIAEAWKMTVEAPDGPVLVVPGGSVFVPPGRGGWRRFAPGQEPEELGPRTPAPGWQTALRHAPARTAGGCVVDQIPAGLVIRPAGANAPRPGDLFHAIPVDPKHPAVVVGVPWGEDVVATDVAEVLAALPAVVRRGVRLAPGGRRDLLPLGQSVAGLLNVEIEVTTGLPLIAADRPLGRFGVRSVLTGPDGEPRWLPFVDAVMCLPPEEPVTATAGEPEPAGTGGGPARSGPTTAPAPRLLRWSTPAPELGLTQDGVARLSDAWQAVATRAGLWVGPSGAAPPLTARPVSVEGPVVEVGRGGDRLDASLWPLLSGFLGRLAPDIRSRTTLHVHAITPDGGRALRGLAAEHALRVISFAAAPAARPVRRGPAPAGTAGAPAHGTTGTPASAPIPSPIPRPAPVPVTGSAGGATATSTGGPGPTSGDRPAPPVPHKTSSPPAREAAPGQAAPEPATTAASEHELAGAPGSPGSPDRASLPTSSSSGATEPPGPSAVPTSGASVAPSPVPAPEPSVRPVAGLASASVPPAAAEPVAEGVDEPVARTSTATGTPVGATAVTESAAPEPTSPPLPLPDAPRPEPVPTGAPSTPVAPARPVPTSGSGAASGPAPASSGTPPRTTAPPAPPAPPAPSAPTSPATGESAAETGAAPAGTPAPRPEPAPAPAVTRRPLPPVPVEPQHLSTPSERAAFRMLAEPTWERHSAAVNRALAEMPALRGAEQEAARTDLVALRMYLRNTEAPLDHKELAKSLRSGERRLVPYAACIASALARLPSYRGVVLRGLTGTAELGGVRPGDVLRDAAPVSGLPLDPAGKKRVAGVGFAIWSTTGRRVRRLLDGGDEVVFAPGTAYRVLDVRTDAATSLILLRQVRSAETASVLLEDADETALERLNHALSGRMSPGKGDWPDRCAGPLGDIGAP
ncbi:hypothetical protein [Streptomyces scopuliridis]|uniref:hypothetical protein n=1 Tax=Streptomyces scopuliridis TaxID=452529 RepID=UPI00369D1448